MKCPMCFDIFHIYLVAFFGFNQANKGCGDQRKEFARTNGRIETELEMTAQSGNDLWCSNGTCRMTG
jgi:hypothetical protein